MPPANNKPTICKQLRRHQREHDAQAGRRGDADQDCLGALMGGQAGGGKADDDGIVAGQHQVDHDDLEESGENLWSDKIEQGRAPLSVLNSSPTSQPGRGCQRGPAWKVVRLRYGAIATPNNCAT